MRIAALSLSLGFGLIVVGCFMAYRPLGFIVWGTGLLVAGITAAKRAAK